MTKAAKSADGTMFKDMLRTIARVPRGKVSTYGDIAFAAGYPGAARQVAWALHGCGPGVPWQRIVGAGGNILLTGEHGFEQRLRLQSEGVAFLGIRVNMAEHRHNFFPEKKRTGKNTAKKAAKKLVKVTGKKSSPKKKSRSWRP
jgi:methylated-DNA-protein-cysteine methyltransferase-like protein